MDFELILSIVQVILSAVLVALVWRLYKKQ